MHNEIVAQLIRSIRNRPLTGLEIRAMRTHKNAGATNHCGRSKYTPTGVPCRVTKGRI